MNPFLNTISRRRYSAALGSPGVSPGLIITNSILLRNLSLSGRLPHAGLEGLFHLRKVSPKTEEGNA